MSAQRQRELLQSLSLQPVQTGDALGAALGLSRAAVWKHVRDLRAAGVAIGGAAGEGYRLDQTVDLIDLDTVRRGLASRLPALPVELVWETGSTNQDLAERLAQGCQPPFARLAERQLKGRGRRGRGWVSPLAANLYLSLAWTFPIGVAQLAGLSLALGIACAQTLRELGLGGVAVKWPNDLVVADAKLGGLLVEVEGELQGPCRAVIGLGLNCRMPADAAADIDQGWTDLSRCMGAAMPSRSRLAVDMILALAQACTRYAAEGAAWPVHEWPNYDALSEREIEIRQDSSVVRAIAQGIDGFGRLRAQVDGQLRVFASGEVSVRAR